MKRTYHRLIMNVVFAVSLGIIVGFSCSNYTSAKRLDELNQRIEGVQKTMERMNKTVEEWLQ